MLDVTRFFMPEVSTTHTLEYLNMMSLLRLTWCRANREARTDGQSYWVACSLSWRGWGCRSARYSLPSLFSCPSEIEHSTSSPWWRSCSISYPQQWNIDNHDLDGKSGCCISTTLNSISRIFFFSISISISITNLNQQSALSFNILNPSTTISALHSTIFY